MVILVITFLGLVSLYIRMLVPSYTRELTITDVKTDWDHEAYFLRNYGGPMYYWEDPLWTKLIRKVKERI